MRSKPRITISRIDADRLEQILDLPSITNSAAAVALREELARAEVVEAHEIEPDTVTMNSMVRFQIGTTGMSINKTLSYPTESNQEADRISVLAPVGSALLGLRVGDSIEWPSPGGNTLDVRVEAIQYQPERDGPHAT